MKCLYSIHFICEIFDFNFPSPPYTCSFCACGPESTLSSKPNRALVRAYWKEFHQSSCLCFWFHSHRLVYFILKVHDNWKRLEIITFFHAKDTCIIHEVPQLKSSVRKCFFDQINNHHISKNNCMWYLHNQCCNTSRTLFNRW